MDMGAASQLAIRSVMTTAADSRTVLSSLII